MMGRCKGASKCCAAQACCGECKPAVANLPGDAKAMSSATCNDSPYVVGGAGVATAVDCKGACTVDANGGRLGAASDSCVTVAQLGMAGSAFASSTCDQSSPPLLML